MADIITITKARADAIEANSVVSGEIAANRHLLLTKGSGAVIDAGEAKPNSPVSGALDASGNLVFTLVDGTTQNVGQVAPPSGVVVPFAGAAAPTGYLLCDGSAVSRSGANANLFAAIGTTYGAGDGSTTFNLPDLRGRFPLGVSAGHALASAGGSESKILSAAQMPTHSHTISDHAHNMSHDHANGTTADQGEHNHTFETGWRSDGAVSGGSARYVMIGNQNTGTPTAGGTGSTHYAGNHNHNFDVPAYTGNTGAAGAGVTGTAGSGNAFDVMNPFLSLNYIIKK